MRKLHIFLIILFIVIPLVLMGTYVIYEPSRTTLEGIFMPLIEGVTPTVMSLRSSFMALPYWQWIGVGIVIALTIFFDRKMHWIWDRLQWGTRGDPRKFYRARGPTPDAPVPIPQQKEEEPPAQEIAEQQ